MTIFHFFKKEKVITHLDINSNSFETEKTQLIEQGFERVGEPIHSENSKLALEKFHDKQFLELFSYCVS